MSNDTKLHEAAAAGHRAASALEVVGEAFAALEAEYTAAWKNTAARDQDARERLFLATQIAGKVRAHLKRMVDDGRLAERELNEISRYGERRKLLGLV